LLHEAFQWDIWGTSWVFPSCHGPPFMHTSLSLHPPWRSHLRAAFQSAHTVWLHHGSVLRFTFAHLRESTDTFWLPIVQCLGPTFAGDFHLKGADLRKRGLNRIGNLLVPNSNYCAFEDWVMPILDAMLEEQTSQGTRWTPSKVQKGFASRTCSSVGDCSRTHTTHPVAVCRQANVPVNL
jgi:hypothetical protein